MGLGAMLRRRREVFSDTCLAHHGYICVRAPHVKTNSEAGLLEP